MIVSWKDKIKAGSTSNHISAFWDVMPTLADAAGTNAPNNIDGISFLPELLNQTDQAEHEFLYWEFPSYGGQQAVRMGNWKAIRKDIFKGNMNIELYDLSSDITEENNIANDHPEIIRKVEQIMKNEHTEPHIDRFKIEQLGDKKSN